MASVRTVPSKTGGGPPSYRVEWRMGGRDGAAQTCTMATYDPDALAAKALAEARRHMVTDVEVYRAVLGLAPSDAPALAAPTLRQVAQDWIVQRRRNLDVQPDTIDEYEHLIELRILKWRDDLPVTAMDGQGRLDWLAWLAAQRSRRSGGTLAPGTVMRAHAVMHAMLDSVPQWLPRNPCAKPPGRRKRAPGLPKVIPYEAMFLTPAEVDIIDRHCPELIADMVETAVRTGLRLGELLVLRVGEDAVLTGKRRHIKVRRALKTGGTIGPPKSRRSRRDVSITADTAERLVRLAKGKRRGDLFFPAPRGGLWVPSNLRAQHWVPALAAAQRCAVHMPPMPVKGRTGPARKLRPDEVSTCDCETRLHRRPRWHDLRHTHVGLCVEAGWDITRVSRRLGHESVQITIDLYGHLWEGADGERLDEVDRLLLLESDEAA